MKNKGLLRLLVGILCGIYIAPSLPFNFSFMQNTNINTSTNSIQKDGVNTMSTIYSILQDDYFYTGHLALTGMIEGSIQGFVSALKDPYTEYFTTQQNTTFSEELQGQEEFEGIGAAVQKKDLVVQIQEVYKGTPAAIAGLHPLDAIIEIDGEKTKDMTISEAVKKIRGPKGTKVKLLILRELEKDPTKRVFTVEATRAHVSIPSVKVELMNNTGTSNKFLYIEIALIGEKTEDILKSELAEYSGQNINGVILDLRGNGGGYLPKAVEILSHFIPTDTVVLRTRYKISPNETYLSKGYGELEKAPVVVLVDALTASAGEIIAGALQQLRHAPLIGTTTFGKGSIQTITDIGSGAGLKYTIGKRYLPDDTNIDHTGLKVDIEVPFDRALYEKDHTDVQMKKAIEEIKKLMK